jgi:hypothetical protein
LPPSEGVRTVDEQHKEEGERSEKGGRGKHEKFEEEM